MSGDKQNIQRIQPVHGLIPLNLHELWEYRELVFFFLWRDVKGRYRQMALGPFWIVLAPLVNMVLFTIIFGMAAKFPMDDVPRPLFIYSALLPWGFFAGSLTTSANSLLSGRALISKVYFPRLTMPIVGVFSAFIDFLISFCILLVMTLAYGYPPTVNMLFIPVFLLLAALTGLAVGLWAATWIVHFRDVNNILTYGVKLWMYASPVVYSASVIPERFRALYQVNPMTNVIDGFRWCMLGVGTVSVGMTVVSFAIVMPVLISGAYYFRRTERSIVDIA